MRKTISTLVMLLVLALLAAPQAWAGGKGQGQGRGNQAGGAQQQGQWVNNQPPGWNNDQGKRQGWTRQGSSMPVGLDKNYTNTGKYPKGLQKTR